MTGQLLAASLAPSGGAELETVARHLAAGAVPLNTVQPVPLTDRRHPAYLQPRHEASADGVAAVQERLEAVSVAWRASAGLTSQYDMVSAVYRRLGMNGATDWDYLYAQADLTAQDLLKEIQHGPHGTVLCEFLRRRLQHAAIVECLYPRHALVIGGLAQPADVGGAGPCLVYAVCFDAVAQ